MGTDILDERPVIVVVPEGLAADAQGNGLPVPSFVFRQVMDVLSETAIVEDTVYLAPGNCFDTDVSEQVVAREYLGVRCAARLFVPDTGCVGYVDTRGNARLLRKFLEQKGQWPLSPVRLYVASPHARRSSLCFRKEGFLLAEVRPVKIIIENEPVVRRLWYYKSRFWHRVYEMGAIAIDLIRPGVRN